MEPKTEGKKSSAFTILKTLKRRKYYLLVPLVLIPSAVAFYVQRLPDKFRARTLVASQASVPMTYLSGRVDPVTTVNVQDQLRTIRETVLNPDVLETINREFNLYPAKDARDAERAKANIASQIEILVDSPDAFYIGFIGRRPQEVAQVANRLAGLFVDRTTEYHVEQTAKVDDVLDSEVERLRRQLKAQEDGLKAYKDSVATNLPDLMGANFRTLATLQDQAQSKADKIAEAQATRAAAVKEMQSLESQGALETAPREKTPTEIAIDDLKGKIRQARTRYTAENPEIQRMEKELHDLEVQGGTQVGARREPSQAHMRYVQLQAQLSSTDQAIKAYQQDRASLVSQMPHYEQRINASPGLETAMSERMRDVALTRTQYETLLAKQQAQKLDQRVEQSAPRAAYKVAEPAQPPTEPYSPQRLRLILMAIVASLGMGFGAIVLTEHMDTSFETTEEVQGFTNIPVLSAIPNIDVAPLQMRTSRNGHNGHNGHNGSSSLSVLKPREDGISDENRKLFQKHRIAVLSDPQSIASQQYGILTLKVQRWKEQTGGRVLVVTSAAGGEGKSLTAVNLAMSLAGSLDGKVLLVDCDLRRPQVHERLGLEDKLGLSDLMAVSDRPAEPYITKVGNLYVMPGGQQLSEPIGLSMRRTREILRGLSDEYQFIVLDSPPIVPIADSHFLAGLADGVVMVVRARETRRELLQRAVESLGATNIVGVVLNDAEFGDTRYAYAYRYYQRNYVGRR